jgi:hypothetical protein
MARTLITPKKVLLTPWLAQITEGEDADGLGTFEATEAITPGHLVELVDSGSENKWQKHATAANVQPRTVAIDQSWNDLGVDDAYAAGDAVAVAHMFVGCVFWGLISSGQDISNGEHLQSAGDGTLKSATASTAAANVAHYISLDNPGSVTVSTRIRAMVI